jgi:hypothetical protein
MRVSIVTQVELGKEKGIDRYSCQEYAALVMTIGNIESFNPQRNGGTPMAAAVIGCEGTMLDKRDTVELPLAFVDAYLESIMCGALGGLGPGKAADLPDMAREKLSEAHQALKARFEQPQGEGEASL